LVLLRETGCLACHSLDGSKLVGPSFKGVYNSERVVIDSNEEITIVADEDYLKRSIYKPDVQLVKGFNKGLMKSYEGIVSEEEAGLMINYLKEVE
ncbi:MAG TPA: c-type cytochrome, partial [Bacteroidales bacterium]|nr:c-type cytochrome [Bacteroidales bacterium]